MDERTSFIMYDLWCKYVVRLSDECALQLSRAICSYALGIDYEIKDQTVAVIFESIKEQMDDDYMRYQKRCETNSRNRKKTMSSNETNINDGQRSSTFDNDGQRSGCDNDNDNDNDNISNQSTTSKNLNSTTTTTTSSAVQMVVEEYNKTSFPKVQRVSEQRRKAIKARLKTFSLEEILKAFKMADASSFLHGNGDKNWVADFDWIMGVKSGGDQHLTRILEGHYSKDKSETARSGTTPKNKFINFQQRKTDYDSIVAAKNAERMNIPYNDTPE